jgi:hypothetical protein
MLLTLTVCYLAGHPQELYSYLSRDLDPLVCVY